jgi:hypothetical protein
MIISHKHQFIFIKTNKTAGTSTEIALSGICGSNDVISPIDKKGELLRVQHGGTPPQNCLPHIRGGGMSSLYNSIWRKRRFNCHCSASHIKSRLCETKWNNYYKFCFERNPWDRVVSLYYFRNRAENRPHFSDFVRSNEILRLKRLGSNLYRINGGIAVDKIYRFEDLPQALQDLRERLNLPEIMDLPFAKSRHRKCDDYRAMYSRTDRERVSEVFKDEINLLGYEF